MKHLILLFLLIISQYTFSQESKFKILLGKNENYVRNYLDSIVNVNKSPGVYKEEGKNQHGQISMGVYSEDDESILDCLVIYCFFQKLGNDQVCVRQLIGGDPEYGENNKDKFLKGFNHSSKNKWTKPFDMGFTILAEYMLEEETYYLTYSLIESPKL